MNLSEVLVRPIYQKEEQRFQELMQRYSWNYDEDRSRISMGYGPENVTRFRRFAVSIIKSKGVGRVAQKMRELTRNTRPVFDYLKMTKNSCKVSTTLKE